MSEFPPEPDCELSRAKHKAIVRSERETAGQVLAESVEAYLEARDACAGQSTDNPKNAPLFIREHEEAVNLRDTLRTFHIETRPAIGVEFAEDDPAPQICQKEHHHK